MKRVARWLGIVMLYLGWAMPVAAQSVPQQQCLNSGCGLYLQATQQPQLTSQNPAQPTQSTLQGATAPAPDTDTSSSLSVQAATIGKAWADADHDAPAINGMAIVWAVCLSAFGLMLLAIAVDGIWFAFRGTLGLSRRFQRHPKP